MESAPAGQVDVEREGFVARFKHDPSVLAQIKTIQRGRWWSDRRVWLVDRHWPSVSRLFHIASKLDWTITGRARAAMQEVRATGEFVEYSVDVFHDYCGDAWFLCVVGEDDEVRRRVSAIPGAYRDDGIRIPTDWDQCCGPLREIVENDSRFELSNAARMLLTEPDVTHLYLRSGVPNQDAPSAAEQGFPEEVDLDALVEPPREATPAKRKPRVTSRNPVQPASQDGATPSRPRSIEGS